jgi:hypothetical protein
MTRGHADWFKPHRGSDFPFPGNEQFVNASESSDDGWTLKEVISQVLDDTYDTFLTRGLFTASRTSLWGHLAYQDVIIYIKIGADDYWQEYMLEGMRTPPNTVISSTTYGITRPVIFHGIRIPAGSTVTASMAPLGTGGVTLFDITLFYITEVTA